MDVMLGLFYVALAAFIGAVLYWLPRYARQDLFFAVTVPAEVPGSAAGRAIRRRYSRRVAAITLAMAALAAWGAASREFPLALAAPLIQAVLGFFAFLAARREALGHAVEPTSLREARLGPRHVQLPGLWIGELIPLGILAAVGYQLHLNWQKIPERFPNHWGLDGQVNGWGTRTFGGVYAPLLVGAAVIAGLVLLSWAIVRWTRRVHASGTAAEADIARERRILLLLVFTEYVMAGILTWAALLPLRAAPAKPPTMLAPLGLVCALLVVLMVVIVTSPSTPAPAEGGQPVGDRTADRYWKAGIFYVNREDSSLLVEKRFGVGYTLNFGHWVCWAILVGLLAIPLAVPLVTLLLPQAGR